MRNSRLQSFSHASQEWSGQEKAAGSFAELSASRRRNSHVRYLPVNNRAGSRSRRKIVYCCRFEPTLRREGFFERGHFRLVAFACESWNSHCSFQAFASGFLSAELSSGFSAFHLE